MIKIIRTDSTSSDFKKLLKPLDKELAITDGDEHEFYSQFNRIDSINHVLLGYDEHHPIACGAIKEFDSNSMEIKRMYVDQNFRGKGIGSLLLKELEIWTQSLGYQKCVLETGIRQGDAIALYKKNNYSIISNYGQYIGKENSICFEKLI